MSSLEERATAKAEAVKELRRQNMSGNAYKTPTRTQQQFTEHYSPGAGTEIMPYTDRAAIQDSQSLVQYCQPAVQYSQPAYQASPMPVAEGGVLMSRMAPKCAYDVRTVLVPKTITETYVVMKSRVVAIQFQKRLQREKWISMPREVFIPRPIIEKRIITKMVPRMTQVEELYEIYIGLTEEKTFEIPIQSSRMKPIAVEESYEERVEVSIPQPPIIKRVLKEQPVVYQQAYQQPQQAYQQPQQAYQQPQVTSSIGAYQQPQQEAYKQPKQPQQQPQLQQPQQAPSIAGMSPAGGNYPPQANSDALRTATSMGSPGIGGMQGGGQGGTGGMQQGRN